MSDLLDDLYGHWKFTDAKAHFSEVMQLALAGKPQRIIRNGRESVIVVAESEYTRAVAPKRSLVDLFSALRGTALDLRRDDDVGRDVEL